MDIIEPQTFKKLKDNGAYGGKILAKLEGGGAVWLLTGMENDNDTLWALSDIGKGFIEYGQVSLAFLNQVNKVSEFRICQDKFFVPTGDLQDYLKRKTLLDLTQNCGNI